MKIVIKNFGKYNPRCDVKNASWYRMERNWWVDMFDWPADAQRVWFMLLGLARHAPGTPPVRARTASGTSADAADREPPTPSEPLDTSAAFIAANLRIAPAAATEAVRFLIGKKRVDVDDLEDGGTDAVRARTGDVRGRTATGRDGTGRDETERDGTEEEGRARKRTHVDPPPPPADEPADPLGDAEPSPEPDGEDLPLAAAWLKHAHREMPWKRPPKSWTLERFAADIGKLRRKAGLTAEGITRVMAWAFDDGFWKDKVLSPDAMTAKSGRNGQTKLDNVLLGFKRFTAPHDEAERMAEILRAGGGKNPLDDDWVPPP